MQVWGWNGGRVRAIADGLSEQGYKVAVGKFLAPALDGGTDGDALPPDGDFSMDWIKQFPWETQRPKVEAALGFLKAEGCSKIGVLGFCYGGHPACWASTVEPSVVCGVVLHPSMQLEGFAFGGDTAALLKSVIDDGVEGAFAELGVWRGGARAGLDPGTCGCAPCPPTIAERSP